MFSAWRAHPSSSIASDASDQEDNNDIPSGGNVHNGSTQPPAETVQPHAPSHVAVPSLRPTSKPVMSSINSLDLLSTLGLGNDKPDDVGVPTPTKKAVPSQTKSRVRPLVAAVYVGDAVSLVSRKRKAAETDSVEDEPKTEKRQKRTDVTPVFSSASLSPKRKLEEVDLANERPEKKAKHSHDVSRE